MLMVIDLGSLIDQVVVGLVIDHVVVGLLIVGYGAQKLFGWFGGRGLAGTSAWIDSLGLRQVRFWSFVEGAAAFLGGMFIALGYLHPLDPLAIIAVMSMVIALVHGPKGLRLTRVPPAANVSRNGRLREDWRVRQQAQFDAHYAHAPRPDIAS